MKKSMKTTLIKESINFGMKNMKVFCENNGLIEQFNSTKFIVLIKDVKLRTDIVPERQKKINKAEPNS
jgi:hypothetical protein